MRADFGMKFHTTVLVCSSVMQNCPGFIEQNEDLCC